MKIAALDVYVCPACRGALAPRIDVGDGNEILEGALSCAGCAATYPILRGVPRFVPAGAYATSFGYQWNWFPTVQLDSATGTSLSEDALKGTTGWSDAEYSGRRLLDAGVGAGRFAERASAKGADVFGVDLTHAVDAAFRNIGRRPNVHLAQADIFSMPFRTSTFDLAYSIGVLHHTPDPRTAFARVAQTIKPGGRLAVYLYARYGSWHWMSDALRKVTTRLPLQVMRAVSAAAVPLYFVHRIPAVGKLTRLALPISMEPDWRQRWLDTFDWYTPKYQFKYLYPEVFRWFREEGFDVVDIPDGPIRISAVKHPANRPAAHRSDVVDDVGSYQQLVAS